MNKKYKINKHKMSSQTPAPPPSAIELKQELLKSFIKHNNLIKKYPLINLFLSIVISKATSQVVDKVIDATQFSKVLTRFKQLLPATRKYEVSMKCTSLFLTRLFDLAKEENSNFLTKNTTFEAYTVTELGFSCDHDYEINNVKFRIGEKSGYFTIYFQSSKLIHIVTLLAKVSAFGKRDELESKRKITYIYSAYPASVNDCSRKTLACQNSQKTFRTIVSKHKSQVINLIDQFLNRKGNWDPYFENKCQLNFLFYGPPGCGKSSLIKAIAEKTNMDVYKVKLNTKWTDDSFSSMFRQYEKSIFIFEDFDASSLTSLEKRDNIKLSDNKDLLKENKDEKDQKKDEIEKAAVTLSDLLNTLDGVEEISGSIIILTTNHIEFFDSALVRSGRVYKFKMEEYEKEQVVEFLELRCKRSLSNSEKDLVPDNIFITPCEIERICQLADNDFQTIVNDQEFLKFVK